MDDFVIFDRVLLPNEITTRFNSKDNLTGVSVVTSDVPAATISTFTHETTAPIRSTSKFRTKTVQ